MALTHGSDGDYHDYWSEITDIRDGSKDPEPDTGSSEDELEPKTPDEAEAAADWLQSAGYGAIVDQVLEGRPLEDDVFEAVTLTKAQQATIKRRITTLKSTLSRRRQPHAKADVRDIFSGPSNDSAPSRPRSQHAAPRGSYSDTGSSLGVISGSPPPGGPQWLGRNVSIHKRREYDLSGDVASTGPAPGVEVLRIHTLDRPDPDADLRLHSDPGPSLPDASLAAIELRLRRSPRLPPSPRSPRDFYLHELPPPPSPLSYTNSSGSSSPAWLRSPIDYNEGLPQIPIQPDSLGITRISDLGAPDIARLRPLLLLELTALLDQHQLVYVKRKAKKKYKDSGIFGVSLQTLLDADRRNPQHQHLKVPLIFQQLLDFLDREAVSEEGILRVPGSVTRIRALRREIDEKFSSGGFSWSDVHPNDAAGLLKLFLRELPAPLLTAEYVEAFAQIQDIPSLGDQVQALTLLVLLLPDVNGATLRLLLAFLRRVVAATENKMTIHNVAMIMAPNLFLVQSSRSSKGVKDSEFRMAAGTSNIVRMMLFYQDLLWTVPTTMIQQMRHQYETEQNRKSRDKPFMKLLGRKDKAEVYKKPQINNEEDFRRSVIRVQAPAMTKFQKAIQLEACTTAGDIVTRYLEDAAGPQTPAAGPQTPAAGPQTPAAGPQTPPPPGGRGTEPPTSQSGPHTSALYEIGGNIGERRLDNHTRVVEVLKHNPNAEWVIRHSPS